MCSASQSQNLFCLTLVMSNHDNQQALIRCRANLTTPSQKEEMLVKYQMLMLIFEWIPWQETCKRHGISESPEIAMAIVHVSSILRVSPGCFYTSSLKVLCHGSSCCGCCVSLTMWTSRCRSSNKPATTAAGTAAGGAHTSEQRQLFFRRGRGWYLESLGR